MRRHSRCGNRPHKFSAVGKVWGNSCHESSRLVQIYVRLFSVHPPELRQFTFDIQCTSLAGPLASEQYDLQTGIMIRRVILPSRPSEKSLRCAKSAVRLYHDFSPTMVILNSRPPNERLQHTPLNSPIFSYMKCLLGTGATLVLEDHFLAFQPAVSETVLSATIFISAVS